MEKPKPSGESTGTNAPPGDSSNRLPDSDWPQRKILTELTGLLTTVSRELKTSPCREVSREQLFAFEQQLDRLNHLLQHVEDLHRSRLEIQLITQIASKLANVLDLEAMLNLILDSLKQVVDYDAAGIFVMNPNGNLVVGEVIRGYEGHDSGSVRQKLGKGLMGWVMETMAPVVVQDVSRDPRYVEARPQTRSELAVPLFTEGKVIGCFNLESDRLAAFTERDAEHLKTFASHAAVAIQRARMHREILEKQRIDEELAMARRMQLSLLPGKAPHLENFALAGINVPSEEVGGDYYDYIRFTDKDLGIVISDVAGKGIPAAFIMASLRASLRIEAGSRYAIATILSRVNDFLYEFIEPERFVTAFYSVLDDRARLLTFANAGHNPPILIRQKGPVEYLSEGGLLLGAFPAAIYHEHRVSFKPGDLLVLYTDGLSEAEDPSGEQFGTDRIIEVARHNSGRGHRAVISGLLKAVREHTGRMTLQDDITLVVMRCL